MNAPLGFILKKAVGITLMPLSICLILLGLGIVYIVIRRPRQALAPFTIATLLLYAFSLNTVAAFMIRPLERIYPTLDLTDPQVAQTNIKWIVVLGAGHWTDLSLSSTAMLSEAALFRLVEGLRIAHYFPQSRLILSGGVFRDQQANAVVMAKAASELGFDPARILLEDTALDTDDEAKLIKDMVGDDPFILVTSASHMLRAMKLFEQQGLQPIAAPAHFRDKGEPEYLLPRPVNLVTCALATYEYLGLTWSLVLGRINLSPQNK